jgi:hypothetical protein
MEIAWAVSSTLDLDSLLPRVMAKVTEIIKADRATFFDATRTRPRNGYCGWCRCSRAR